MAPHFGLSTPADGPTPGRGPARCRACAARARPAGTWPRPRSSVAPSAARHGVRPPPTRWREPPRSNRGAGGSKPAPSNRRGPQGRGPGRQGSSRRPERSVTINPSATSVATTRSTRSGSPGQPTTMDTRPRWTGPRRRASTSRPRPSRSDPAKRLWGVDTPADPTAGSGCSPLPDAVHRQRRRTGHRGHRGSPATQTSAPRSSRACPKCHPCPRGTMASTRRWASPGLTGRPATARATTRPALVSTTPTSALEGEGHHGPGGVGTHPGKRQEPRRDGEGPDPGGRTRRPGRPGAGCGPAGCSPVPARPGAPLPTEHRRRPSDPETGRGTAGRPAPPGTPGSAGPSPR